MNPIPRLQGFYRRKAASLVFRKPFPVTPRKPLISFTFDDFPRSALLLRLFWWKRPYVEHLVLALHGHTVLFLCLGVALIPLLPFHLLGAAPILWLPLAFRRFYGSPWWVTLLKAVPLAVAYFLLVSAASFGTVVVTLLLE